jgi:FkbM family methyltransferase
MKMQSAKVRNFEVWFENSKEFHSLKREIFGEDLYYVELPKKDPLIFDVGAHIGLATLYFNMLYPKAKIVAVEPHPKAIEVLRRNIELNRLEDVEVVEAAIAGEEGKRSFFVDVDGEWLSSSSFAAGAWNGAQKNTEMVVKTILLGDLIEDRVDLLKLDVEGAEEEVLMSLGEKLRKIDRILFEYHPQKKGSAKKIVDLLHQHGFGVTFYKGSREVDWHKTKGLLLGEAVRS